MEKLTYTTEGNIDLTKTIRVGAFYERIDFAWIPERIEGKLIWLKHYKTIIKVTMFYPAVWGVTDSDFDYEVIEQKLIK